MQKKTAKTEKPEKPKKGKTTYMPKKGGPHAVARTNQKEENQRAFLRVLPLCRWNITEALRQIGMERSIYQVWVKDPAFAAKIEVVKEEHLDWLEERLHQRIEDGSDMLLKFALESKGKSRGYGKETTAIEANVKPDGMQLLIDFGSDD